MMGCLRDATHARARGIRAEGTVSGGSFAVVSMGVQGYPTLQSLLDNDNFNTTANDTAFAELGGKAELGFPITYVALRLWLLLRVTHLLLSYQLLGPLVPRSRPLCCLSIHIILQVEPSHYHPSPP